MIEQELYQLTHPEEWPYGDHLPVVRRGGNPVWDVKDAGIVMDDNLCRVWVGVYIGDADPTTGVSLEYSTHEGLLTEWEID